MSRPVEDKRTAQHAPEDAKRTTPTATEPHVAEKDAGRDRNKDEAPHKAEKDANRSGGPMSAKSEKFKERFQKAHAKCVEKGMASGKSEEDAKKDADEVCKAFGEEDDEAGEGEPDGDEAKKALQEVKDAIESGKNYFTKDDVAAIAAEHQGEYDRMVKSFDGAQAKMRERLADIEKAFLAQHTMTERVLAALAENVEVKKSLMTQMDEMKKSLVAAPVAVVAEVIPVAETEDEAKKSLKDNAPVEAPKAVVIQSPMDDTGAAAATAITNLTISDKAKGLLKAGVTDDNMRKSLVDAVNMASDGRNTKLILQLHGKALGMADAQ